MKQKFTLLNVFFIFCISSSSFGQNTIINNFETVAPNNVVRYGASLSIVANPLVNATNATTRVARVGRTTANWYELFAFSTAPLVVPANTTYYLHTMVRYSASADAGIRVDAANRDVDGVAIIRANNPYTTADANQWKDLVFAIPGGATGRTIANIQFHADQGFENIPAGQILNNTTNFGYIDEFFLGTSAVPRTAVAAPTLATTLANFDGISPTATTDFGATQAVVANPYPNGGNTSANVSRIGRTGVNWFEVTKFDIPDFTLLAGETRYIHVAVNYPASPVAVIRIDADAFFGQTDILPVNTYAAASNGHWQDLVFAVTGGPNGSTVSSLVIGADAGNFGTPPTGTVLNNTTNFAFVDNIIINNSPAPLFTARTGLQAVTLYAGANTNPLPRLVDYTAAGVTGVTVGNLVAVNAAIDAASPAPTTLAQVQAVVTPVTALATITDYAASNANPTPTVANYTEAGATGVSAGNLSGVNAAIDAASPAPTTLAGVQSVIDALSFVPVVLNDFETVAPNNVVRYGSALSIVANPLVNATNATIRVARLGRTSANWYELFAFGTQNIVVPANTTYYLHTMVRAGVNCNVVIRYNGANRDADGTNEGVISPLTALVGNGQWQDLVFPIVGGATGITVNNIQISPDASDFDAPVSTLTPVLDNVTNFAFFDEFLVSGSPVARTAVAAPTLATTLANFDGISPAATTAFGATQAVVANPYPNGGNTSANAIRIGRTSGLWFEYTQLNIPDFTLAAGETRYIHVAVNYPSLPVVSIRIDVDTATAPGGAIDILPLNTYASASNGHWQDLVFAVNGGANGLSVNTINLLSDIGNGAGGALVLNNSTSFAYVDNIVINDIATALFTARTGLQAITLYAGANTNPLPREVDYSAAGVSGVTTGNLVAVNAAIDAASPAPTTLAAVQTIVNQAVIIDSLSIRLNDFETVAPNNVVRYGSALSIVPNPLVNATNATTRVARLGRTSANWFELFAFNIDPIAVPANTTYYLHTMVRYDAAADVAIRYDAPNRDQDGTVSVRPLNPYTSADAGQWKDLVFPIDGGSLGVTVNDFIILPDLGFENVPAGQILNNTTSFGYLDEFFVNGSSIARTSVAAPTLATTLANFDGISPAATTDFGATQAVVANPYPNGGNTSANVSRIGRTGVNWFEVTKFNIPDFTLLAGETRYIHVAVNYPASPVAVIRIDADAFFGQTDILPVNTYAAASNGHWQDLVFAVTGGPNGSTVNSLVIAADAGNFGTPPTGTVLNNTTNFAFVDNIIINNSPAPLFTARTGLQAITLYAGANTNPLPRLVDYAAAGVTGVTVGNLVAVNAAIDAASPAPIALAEIQTIVTAAANQVSALATITSYATSNANPIPTVTDYTTAGVTGVSVGNLVAVNAAIDAASQAPTTLAGVQAIVNSVNNFVWTGATSTDWSVVSNWNKGILPDLNSVVTIPSGTTFQPTIAANVAINSLTIASGASVSVTANNLTVTGAITNNGTMTLASNSNLIQSGVTNTNTGNITVTRNSNALSRLDYTIWSSPVSSQNLLAFSPATSTTRFYNYNETTNLYNAISDPSMVSFAAATGYLIRMPNTAVTAPLTQTFAGVFTGVPNNGDITKAVSYSGSASFGFNMVGNPYPSTIDANLFLAANTANIESSLYFWRKVNAASGSAYAVYNLLGSTTTPTSAMPNGTIQVGQGFFVKAKSASTITFTNAMRVGNNANQFFKIKATQKDRIWLNLTNTSGAFSQTLVGYLADATPGIDMYDAKYINDSSIALTSNINNEEYSIQGRPSFDVSDVVSLNFKTDVGGAYTIALDHFDGLFAAGQDIYLKDNVTGVETDLKAGSYSFDASAGVANGRFTLKYQKTLKVDEPSFNENSVRVYKNNGILYINSGSAVINNVKVFDIQGKLLTEQKNVKANATVIKDLKATNQVLIVKVTSEDKNEVTKKVMN